jgi:hypothetical protein
MRIIAWMIVVAGMLVSHVAEAQIMAVTLDGDTVLLNANGTWGYLDTSEVVEEVIPVNPEWYVKPEKSKESYTGISKTFTVYFNEKDWERTKPERLNEMAELAFKMTLSDAYGILIYERMEATTETLADIAILQARKVVEDLEIVNKEYRSVNGKQMIALQMVGGIKGLTIQYMNYYYSGPEGSIQFLTFTTDDSIERVKPKMEELLNGLVIKK